MNKVAQLQALFDALNRNNRYSSGTVKITVTGYTCDLLPSGKTEFLGSTAPAAVKSIRTLFGLKSI
jgi:hypothetical protein